MFVKVEHFKLFSDRSDPVCFYVHRLGIVHDPVAVFQK